MTIFCKRWGKGWQLTQFSWQRAAWIFRPELTARSICIIFICHQVLLLVVELIEVLDCLVLIGLDDVKDEAAPAIVPCPHSACLQKSKSSKIHATPLYYPTWAKHYCSYSTQLNSTQRCLFPEIYSIDQLQHGTETHTGLFVPLLLSSKSSILLPLCLTPTG